MGKAALHIAGVTLARDFKKRGIPVGLVHPGVVSFGVILVHKDCDKLQLYHCQTAATLSGCAVPVMLHRLSAGCDIRFIVQVNTEMYNALQLAKNTPNEKRGLNTLTSEQSAERIYKLVKDLTLDNSGSMWDADKGIPIPW